MLSTSNTNSGKSSYQTTTLAQEFHSVAYKQSSLEATINEYGNLAQHQGQEIKSFKKSCQDEIKSLKKSCQEDTRAIKKRLAELQEQINKMQKLSDTQKNKK